MLHNMHEHIENCAHTTSCTITFDFPLAFDARYSNTRSEACDENEVVCMQVVDRM